MNGARLRTLRNIRVTKGTLGVNNMASPASNATSKAVALALRELALSQGDQEGLSEFLTLSVERPQLRHTNPERETTPATAHSGTYCIYTQTQVWSDLLMYTSLTLPVDLGLLTGNVHAVAVIPDMTHITLPSHHLSPLAYDMSSAALQSWAFLRHSFSHPTQENG